MIRTLRVPWVRRALAVVAVLVVLAPASAWAAGQVGYTEPLEIAAEATGATDEATPTPALLSGYTVPGLGSGAGVLGAALLGTAVTFAAALGLGRLLDRDA